MVFPPERSRTKRAAVPTAFNSERAVNSEPLLSSTGKVELVEGPGWKRDKHTVSTFKINQGRPVAIDKLTYKLTERPVFQHIEEEAKCPANPSGVCMRLKIVGPKGDVLLDTNSPSAGIWKSGTGAGDNWKFWLYPPDSNPKNPKPYHYAEWIELNAYSEYLDVQFNKNSNNEDWESVPLYVSPDSTITMEFSWRDEWKDASQIKQELEIFGKFAENLSQPTIPADYAPECSVSTIFNSHGIPGRPITLYKQSIGKVAFGQVGQPAGWNYNATAFSPKNGLIYAVSQTTKDSATYPAAHLLAINRETGNIQDLGALHNFYPNDNNVINTGFFTPDGQYWVGNAAARGAGLLYNINLDSGVVTPVNLKLGTTPSANDYPQDARVRSNDFTFAKDNPKYAFGLMNQNTEFTKPTLERVNLDPESENFGKIDRIALDWLRSDTGAKLVTGQGSYPGAHYYGAAWTYGDGTLGFSRNDGRIVHLRIENPEAEAPGVVFGDQEQPNPLGIELLGSVKGPKTNANDGASCQGTSRPNLSVTKTFVEQRTVDNSTETVWHVTVSNSDAPGTGPAAGFRMNDILPAAYQSATIADLPDDQSGGDSADPDSAGGGSAGDTSDSGSSPDSNDDESDSGTADTLLKNAVCNSGVNAKQRYAIQCQGGSLDVGESYTFVVTGVLKSDHTCEANTSTISGFDHSDNEIPVEQLQSTAECPTFSSKKEALADQNPATVEADPKAPVTNISDGKAQVVVYYKISVAKKLPGSQQLPGPIVDTPKLPEGFSLKEFAYSVDSPVPVTEAKTLKPGDNNEIRIPVDSIGKVGPDGKEIFIRITAQAEANDSAALTDERLTCEAGKENKGFINKERIEEVSDSSDPQEDNSACVSGQIPPKFNLQKTVQEGRETASVERFSDNNVTKVRMTSYYTVIVRSDQKTAVTLPADVIDTPDLAEGVEVESLEYATGDSNENWTKATKTTQDQSPFGYIIPKARFGSVGTEGTSVPVKLVTVTPLSTFTDSTSKANLVCSDNTAKKGLFNSAVIQGVDETEDPRADNSACVTPTVPMFSSKKTVDDETPATVEVNGNTATLTSYYKLEVKSTSEAGSDLFEDVIDTPRLAEGVKVSGLSYFHDGEWVEAAKQQQGEGYNIPKSLFKKVTSEGKEVKIKMVSTTGIDNLTGANYENKLKCAEEDGVKTPQKGLFNHVEIPGIGDTEDPRGDNDACVMPRLPKLVVSKDPRPGNAVQATPDGKATLVYTISVENKDDSLKGNTGVLVDQFNPTNRFITVDEVTVVQDSPDPTNSEVEVAGFVESPVISEFTGTGAVIASDVILPPGAKQTFTVTVKVTVTETSENWASTIGKCDAEPGASDQTPGIRNKVKMDAVDTAERPLDDDEACIPVTRPEDATLVLKKMGYDPAAGSPDYQPLEGAGFAVYPSTASEDGSESTTYAPDYSKAEAVLTADPQNTGVLVAENLKPGIYFLVETHAPAGYSLLPAPVQFTIEPKQNGSGYQLSGVEEGAIVQIPTPQPDDSMRVSMQINDVVQGQLPASGGPGVPWYLALGALLMTLGFAWARKNTSDLQKTGRP